MVSIDHPKQNPQRRQGKSSSCSLKKCFKTFVGCLLCLFLLPTILVVLFEESSPQQSANHLVGGGGWSPMEPASGLFSSSQQQQEPLKTRVMGTRNLNDENEFNPKTADGFFNGIPVQLRQDASHLVDPLAAPAGKSASSTSTTPTIHSSVHCVGDSYEPDAWLDRSCAFHMLCYDLQEHDFVLLQSHTDEILQRFLRSRPAMKTSSATFSGPHNNASLAVALGGLNLKWSINTRLPPSSMNSLKWFPRIVNATPGMYYYALPKNVVLVPYHSLSAKNPGHLVWDDFLPIYTLLTMFQLLPSNNFDENNPNRRILMPLRVLFDDEKNKLWASCEASEENEHSCQKMTHKFLGLLLGKDYPYNVTRADQVHFVLNSNNKDNSNPQQQQEERTSNYVCAPRGAAGLGALTDHGTKKLHGWMRDDYKTMHNHGRGALLYEFRNFMLQNLGIPTTPLMTASGANPPYKIVFSLSSSDIQARNLDFGKQMATLQQNFPSHLITVESYTLKDLSVQQQVQLASETAIFITICGGGAVTGMFLPKGASVILYYLEHGGVERGIPTHLPAFLDWDLFNNLAHIRTHWLPVQTMDQTVDLRALVLLIRQELELMQNDIMI